MKNENEVKKSMVSNPIAGTDINTMEEAITEMATKDNSWVVEITARMSEAEYGALPAEIFLPNNRILFLSKVDDGIYSGFVKLNDLESGNHGEILVRVEKMSAESIVQALKAKDYLPTDTEAKAAGAEKTHESQIDSLLSLLDKESSNQRDLHIHLHKALKKNSELDAQIDRFKTRTNEHIAKVVKNLEFLATVTDLDSEKLREIGLGHDHTKFEPDMIEPYSYVNEYYRLQKLKKDPTRPKPSREATKYHVETEKHHPEAHTNINDMNDYQIAEMVSDWEAMAQEVGGTTREWADKTVGAKFKFDAERTNKIYEYISLFENKERLKKAEEDLHVYLIKGGKRAKIGETRKWADGMMHRKTEDGTWVTMEGSHKVGEKLEVGPNKGRYPLKGPLGGKDEMTSLSHHDSEEDAHAEKQYRNVLEHPHRYTSLKFLKLTKDRFKAQHSNLSDDEIFTRLTDAHRSHVTYHARTDKRIDMHPDNLAEYNIQQKKPKELNTKSFQKTNLLGNIDFGDFDEETRNSVISLLKATNNVMLKVGVTLKKSINFSVKTKMEENDRAKGAYSPVTHEIELFSETSGLNLNTVLHEVGHAIDYSMEAGNVLSSRQKARELANQGKSHHSGRMGEVLQDGLQATPELQKDYEKLAKLITDTDFYKRAGDEEYQVYIRNSTEIFARAFEVYAYGVAKKSGVPEETLNQVFPAIFDDVGKQIDILKEKAKLMRDANKEVRGPMPDEYWALNRKIQNMQSDPFSTVIPAEKQDEYIKDVSRIFKRILKNDEIRKALAELDLLDVLTKGKKFEVGHHSTWADGTEAVKEGPGNWKVVDSKQKFILKKKDSNFALSKEGPRKFTNNIALVREFKSKEAAQAFAEKYGHDAEAVDPNDYTETKKDADKDFEEVVWKESADTNLIGSIDFSMMPKALQKELLIYVNDCDTILQHMGIVFKTPLNFLGSKNIKTKKRTRGTYGLESKTITLKDKSEVSTTIMHEVGHAIDYAMHDGHDNTSRSSSVKTQDSELASKYKELESIVTDSEYYQNVVPKFGAGDQSELNTPHEVFARGFEVYAYVAAQRLEKENKISKGFNEVFNPAVYKTIDAEYAVKESEYRHQIKVYKSMQSQHARMAGGEASTKLAIAIKDKHVELMKFHDTHLKKGAGARVSPEKQKEYEDKIFHVMDYILKHDEIRKAIRSLHHHLLGYRNDSL